MKLLKLSYIDSKWELQNLELSNLNLIVSKNATGKSRTLSTIDLLVKMITQQKNLNWGVLNYFAYQTPPFRNLLPIES